MDKPSDRKGAAQYSRDYLDQNNIIMCIPLIGKVALF